MKESVLKVNMVVVEVIINLLGRDENSVINYIELCILVFLLIFISLPLFILISIYKMKSVSVYLFFSLHKFYPNLGFICIL